MFRYWRITLPAILLLALVLSCSKSTKNENGVGVTKNSLIDFTPKENEEAELAALCLSGEIAAPDSLYNQILHDLAAIRTAFGDTFEQVNQIEFMTPWVAGCLLISFDDTTAQQILEGEYHAWDSLNEQYQVADMDTKYLARYGFILISFEGRLHPLRLGELYGVLPGVEVTSPNYYIGDWSNVYARQTQDGFTYLFRKGWGDCPSGCIYSEYWYFSFDGGQPFFIGHWAPSEEPEVPDWWGEARLNREHYCDP